MSHNKRNEAIRTSDATVSPKQYNNSNRWRNTNRQQNNKRNAARTRNTGTQTDKNAAALEIARLQEKVRLLEIELSVVRKYIADKPSDVLKEIVASELNDEITVDINQKLSPENSKNVEQKRQSTLQRLARNGAKETGKGCACKGSCSNKKCGCVREDSKCGSLCKCNNSSCQNQMEAVEPEKPQIEPLQTLDQVADQTDINTVSDTSSFLSKMEITGACTPPADFFEPHVDWEEYQAQLVACDKCKRKFHPWRIKKHESCCKKL